MDPTLLGVIVLCMQLAELRAAIRKTAKGLRECEARLAALESDRVD